MKKRGILAVALIAFLLIGALCKNDDNKSKEPAPVAEFGAVPRSGDAPLSVQFTDLSENTVTLWAWDFNNDGVTDSTEQSPTFVYETPGMYTVKLTVTGPGGSNVLTKDSFIDVIIPPPPVAEFTATPTAGAVPFDVVFTDASEGDVSSWEWDLDGDGTIDSEEENPTFSYTEFGEYTVSLTVTGLGGSNTCTKRHYILAVNGIWYVDCGVAESGDGSSLDNAFKTIQEALDVAAGFDLVQVANGVYRGEGNKNLSFYGSIVHLKSIGGAENCIIDCEQDGRGFIFNYGESNETIVDGLTVRNGLCEDDVFDSGGGILCMGSNPTIKNCIITNNEAYDGAGGIQCAGASAPIITDCVISNNIGGFNEGAGGIYCTNISEPTITNCTITGNYSYYGAGGIGIYMSGATITDCIITDNSLEWGEGGGGIGFKDYAYATITNCTIARNSRVEIGSGAGGVYIDYDSEVVLNNCVITNNTGLEGGGVYVSWSGALLTNCLIANNSGGTGGVCCDYWSNVRLVNCTVANNTGDWVGGVSCGNYDAGTATLDNTIIWGNISLSEYGHQLGMTWSVDEIIMNYCVYSDGDDDIDMGAEYNPGNIEINNSITANPMFANAGESDFRLQSNSPCVDAGNSELLPQGIRNDLAGSNRIRGDSIDIGAYER
ncbi:MAG: PKD domain-containing protein [Planctomycetota bacterium]